MRGGAGRQGNGRAATAGRRWRKRPRPTDLDPDLDLDLDGPLVEDLIETEPDLEAAAPKLSKFRKPEQKKTPKKAAAKAVKKPRRKKAKDDEAAADASPALGRVPLVRVRRSGSEGDAPEAGSLCGSIALELLAAAPLGGWRRNDGLDAQDRCRFRGEDGDAPERRHCSPRWRGWRRADASRRPSPSTPRPRCRKAARSAIWGSTI